MTRVSSTSLPVATIDFSAPFLDGASQFKTLGFGQQQCRSFHRRRIGGGGRVELADESRCLFQFGRRQHLKVSHNGFECTHTASLSIRSLQASLTSVHRPQPSAVRLSRVAPTVLYAIRHLPSAIGGIAACQP